MFQSKARDLSNVFDRAIEKDNGEIEREDCRLPRYLMEHI